MNARSLFAGFFIILFALALSGYIVMSSIASTATDTKFYQSAFEASGLYEELYANKLPAMLGGFLTQEQIAQVKQDLTFPRFKAMIDSTISQLIDYMAEKREAVPVLSVPPIMGFPASDKPVTGLISEPSLLQMRSIVKQFFFLTNLLLVAAIISFVIAVALGRELIGRILLAGKALVAGGVFSFISCAGILAVPLLLLGALRSSLNGQTLISLAEPVMGEFISRVFWSTVISAIILLLAGAALIALGYVLKRRSVLKPAKPALAAA